MTAMDESRVFLLLVLLALPVLPSPHNPLAVARQDSDGQHADPSLAVSPPPGERQWGKGTQTWQINVDFAEMKRILASNEFVVVDVREPKEIAAGAIPGTINIPLSYVPKEFAAGEGVFRAKYGRSLSANGDNVVFTCRSGRRAVEARDAVLPLGYIRSRVYKGSYLDWVKNGGPVVIHE